MPAFLLQRGNHVQYSSIWVKNESFKLLGIADVHIGSPQSKFSELKEILKSLGENDYVVFLGDVIDNAIIDSVSNVYEQTMNPDSQIRGGYTQQEDSAERGIFDHGSKLDRVRELCRG